MPLKRLIASLALIAVISGCSIGSRTHDLDDVTKTEVIVLKKKPGQGPVYSLSVVGHGNINGNAEISLVLNGGPYKTEKLSGKVDFRWGGDWYSDQAEIRYIPGTVAGGSLSLKYKFND
jgi:hypothetical protein